MPSIATERPFNIATHNGCITITSIESGEHRTIRIRTKSEKSKFAPGSRVAELLTGPDSESDYTAFGFVSDRGQVFLFKKHRESAFYGWIKRFMESPERFADKVEVNFEGRCRRCNRLLTTGESVARGIGPECARKVGM